ncbi:MAG: amidohydrolase, partial [Candidatus Dormiibacterota bacterium]
PELALTEDQALAAYTSGVAYAAGLEGEQGRLLPGYRCDLTLVKDGRAVGTVIDGQLVDGG